jgi:8-oxo-dGTP pyrophosphatase MutT (NUDIX family)
MTRRVRAVIIQNDKLLSIRREKENETYWIFPGGGVEGDENDQEALIRECKEELGVEVEVGEFFAKDIFYWKGIPEDSLFYKCKVLCGELGSGCGPEYENKLYYEGTHDIEWLNIFDLKNIDLRPHLVRDKIFN